MLATQSSVERQSEQASTLRPVWVAPASFLLARTAGVPVSAGKDALPGEVQMIVSTFQSLPTSKKRVVPTRMSDAFVPS